MKDGNYEIVILILSLESYLSVKISLIRNALSLISNDVLLMCKKYYSAVSGVFNDHTYFFPPISGKPYDYQWLKKQYQGIWKKVKGNESKTNAAVYSLRHRYATTVVMKWLNENADLYLCFHTLEPIWGTLTSQTPHTTFIFFRKISSNHRR